MTTTQETEQPQDLKVNLKTITAEDLLSRRANMVELFNLLDDSSRTELFLGSSEEREKKLASLRERLQSVKQEVETLKSESD
ncbi:Htl1 [Kluyveromyces lactis]|nr:Htl1 [Kluyveromyces lactis]